MVKFSKTAKIKKVADQLFVTTLGSKVVNFCYTVYILECFK